MKKIKAYWESEEFDMIKHWVTVQHFVELEIEDDATQEDINDLMKRKDVKQIK